MRYLLQYVLIVIFTAVITINAQERSTEAVKLNDSGVEKYEQGDYHAAVDLISQALKIQPNNPTFQINLGTAFLKLDQFDRAEIAFKRVTELRPEYAVGHNQLGVALMEAGKNREALASFATAMRLKPNDATMMFNAGCIQIRLKNYEDAIRLLNAAHVIEPKNSEVLVNLGYALAMEKKYPKAIEFIRQAAALKPDDKEVQYFLGSLYVAARNKQAALAQQSTVFSMDPALGRRLYQQIYSDKIVVATFDDVGRPRK